MENSDYISYNELVSKKGLSNLCYKDLLYTREWLSKREHIKNRDQYRCTTCNKFPSDEVYFNRETNLKEGYTFIFDLPFNPSRIETHNRKEQEYFQIPNDTRYKIELFYELIKENFNNIYAVIDLLKEPISSQIKLLNDLKTFSKFEQIEHGDNPKVKMNSKVIELHVHHHYYVKDRLPWEYPDLSLITLCNECHWELHKEHRIPFYKDELFNELQKLTVCPRCNGAGIFPEYHHVQNGVCFECNGAMYLELIDYKWE